MAELSFYGAVGSVTGSRFVLDLDGKKNLIDCGLFQGSKQNRLRNWEPFPVEPELIDRVFLTHAHIDHSGYLPRFCRMGFHGKIFSTHATRDLCGIMLRDSAHLQEEDAYWANKRGYSKHSPALPLYSTEDAENAMKFFTPAHYGEDIFLENDVRVKFRDAGHILGSSFVDIKRNNGKASAKILFSGDFGRPDRPVLREPDQVYNVDYLVLESTYGNRLHDDTNPYADLAEIINESYHRRGVLVIPSFSVGRTQTLLYAIRELEEDNKIPAMPVYIDSPMAIQATEVFNHRINDFKLTARKEFLRGKSLFAPKNLNICATRIESKSINQVKEKAIVISASGMATGGRILHHLAARLPGRENTILLIGYQAEGTRGRKIAEGGESVRIHGQEVPIRAKVKSISGFSAHGDYEEILAWLMAFNKPPRKTFLVHGEETATAALAEKIKANLSWPVVIPKFGETHSLEF
ncbi:MAG: MBL fold metallo-hydrolase [Calditrichales bacterium]|nr:MAG: MBL fold metallo-hydrolase [Calditrichales bacterium]